MVFIRLAVIEFARFAWEWLAGDSMRPFIIYVLLIFSPTVVAEVTATSDLYIYVSLIRVERSKDSNSRRTTITLNGDKVVYEKAYQGYRRNKIEPVRKEFVILNEDVKRLEKLIKDHNLLVSDSLRYPTEGRGFVSFEISLDVRSGGKQSRIVISGPNRIRGIKDQKLYMNTRALLDELFRLLLARDEEITAEGDLVSDAL